MGRHELLVPKNFLAIRAEGRGHYRAGLVRPAGQEVAPRGDSVCVTDPGRGHTPHHTGHPGKPDCGSVSRKG